MSWHFSTLYTYSHQWPAAISVRVWGGDSFQLKALTRFHFRTIRQSTVTY